MFRFHILSCIKLRIRKDRKLISFFLTKFQIELGSLEAKLRSLENDLLLNAKTIDKMKDVVTEIKQQQASNKQDCKNSISKGKPSVNKTFASISKVKEQRSKQY